MPRTKLIVPDKIRAGVHVAQNRTPVNVDSIEAMTPEKDHLVTGTFVNIECPGQPAKICCKLYPHMQYFERTFDDGEKATIPLSVARHIKERIFTTTHKHLLDDEGKPVKSDQIRHRYNFVSDNFSAAA